MVHDHWVLPWTKKGSLPQQLEFEFTKGIPGHENSVINQVVARFMTEHSIPGISIAIAQNGRLVYAKGFGYAKKPPGIEPLGVFNRFRIASISKPITAVADRARPLVAYNEGVRKREYFRDRLRV
jgi:Beta-lactamase